MYLLHSPFSGNHHNTILHYEKILRKGVRAAARTDYSLPASWGNTLEHLNVIKVPSGTIMYTGYAAGQKTEYGEHTLGGKCQVYLPREVKQAVIEYNKVCLLLNLKNTNNFIDWEC